MVEVSVVVPCYNSGDFVEDAVSSALTQDGVSVEVIVVDDGSTEPQTLEALQRLRAAGVPVLCQANRGPSAARNAGIARARGEFILPLDADDRIPPGTLALLCSRAHGHPDVGIVAGAVRFFGDEERVEPCCYAGIETMLAGSTIYNTALFRRRDWQQVGGYPEELSFGEDWAFWMRILSLGRTVAVVPDEVLEYRIWSRQSIRSIRPTAIARAQNFVMRENVELYAGQPLFLMEELAAQRLLLAQFRQSYGRLERLKARLRPILSTLRGDRPAPRTRHPAGSGGARPNG